MNAILVAQQVTKSYHAGSVDHLALRGVSLEIGKGEFVAIVGPSGCGKSTLLHLLGGLDRPDSGDVLLEGKSIICLSETEQTLLRRRRIGFVFQKVHLLPMLNALDNVMVPLRLDNIERDQAKAKSIEALEAVGMAHRQNNRPGELSGGEAQRVAIARALVMSPAILLGDEPTGALDSANSKAVIDLFRELVTTNQQTLVIVTHDSSVAESADRIIRMKDGLIVENRVQFESTSSSVPHSSRMRDPHQQPKR